MSDHVNDGPPVDERRVSIEMGGENIVIRSCADIDRRDTTSLAMAVNAATETGTVVVLDPDPVRCDDAFSGSPFRRDDAGCPDHATCRPIDVDVVGSGAIRIAAHRSWWTIDLARARFCQTAEPVDPSFLGADSWTAVVAVGVTPTSLRALTVDGSVVSSLRAHVPRETTAR